MRFVLPLALTLTLVSALACSQSSHSTPKQTSTGLLAPTVRPNIATAEAHETQISPRAKDVTFCVVDLPASWRSALALGKISVPDTERLRTFAVAADGSRVFGSLYSEAWSGVVAVDRQGAVTRIKPSPDRTHDVLGGGDFDGRWLVWGERHSANNLAFQNIWAWDSTTGEVFNIASEPADGGGYSQPVVSQGRVAFELQHYADARYERQLYSLAERKDRAISNGNRPSSMVFWGSKLLLVERDTAGTSGQLEVVDAVTGEPATAPEQLASLYSSGYLTVNGDLAAWTYGGVEYWRASEPEAIRIKAVEKAIRGEWIRIAGDLITWSGDTKQWVADLRSHSIAPFSEPYDDRLTNGSALLVSQLVGPLVKSDDPLLGNVQENDVVDVTKLPPLPGCPA